MHKRDYLVKQFEEFAKVMAILLGLKNNEKHQELEELINTSVLKYTSVEIKYVESILNETLIETLTQEKKLSDEQLKMLADLLFEKGNYYAKTSASEHDYNNCYKKAFLIYNFLNDHATLSYSLDMHYKLEVLKKMEF